ncbi:MAG: amidohydrolase family protein [Ignavibacteria bacterium]|nr:amidohydrolase family protein [Ignavibacteria bacterium]
MESLKIIANAFVLTCDRDNRGGRYNLFIRDGRIAEISDSLDLFTSLHPYATIVDAKNKLIIPGFVNAHFHPDSILLRDRTEGVHFSLWEQDIRFHECSRKLLEASSYDDLRSLYLAVYFSHLKSGTTCVGDFCPRVSEQGLGHVLRAIDGTNVKSVITLTNWDQIAQAKEFDAAGRRFVISLGKEEDYTVYSFENLTRASKKLNIPLLAHLAEQRTDADIIRKNFQKRCLAVLHDYAALRPSTILVHLNHVAEQEVEMIAETGAPVVVCARSAASKQTGYPSLRHLLSHNVRLCIGTDWASVDMMRDMHFLSELPLLVGGIRPIPARELVRMATINGASALGLSAEIGSIERGKKADLTFFNLEDMRLPMLSPHASADELAELLVHHLSVGDISDVMIDGEFYVSNRQIMTMSEEDIIEGFRAIRERFYTVPGKKRVRTERVQLAEQDQATKAKIIPFVSETRRMEEEAEGFVEGFSVVKESDESIDVQKSSLNSPKPSSLSPDENEPPSKGDFSEKSKRVFGEDEEL